MWIKSLEFLKWLMPMLSVTSFSIEGEDDKGGSGDGDGDGDDDGLGDMSEAEEAILKELNADTDDDYEDGNKDVKDDDKKKDDDSSDDDKDDKSKDDDDDDASKSKNKDDDDKDDRGIPSKQKIKELERKLKDRDENLTLMQSQIASLMTNKGDSAKTPKENRDAMAKQIAEQYPNLHEDQINATIDLAMNISTSVVSENLRPHAPAIATVNVNKAKSKIFNEEKDFFNDTEMSSEFDSEMEKVPIQVRMDPRGAEMATQNVMEIVKGRRYGSLKADIAKQVTRGVEEAMKRHNKKIISNDAGMGGRSGSGSKSNVKLNAEQEHERRENGMSPELYMSTLKVRQKAFKDRGDTKIPQTLS